MLKSIKELTRSCSLPQNEIIGCCSGGSMADVSAAARLSLQKPLIMDGFRASLRIVVFSLAFILLVGNLSALTSTKKKKKHAHTSGQAATITQVSTTRQLHRKARYSPWTEPTYADSTAGDNVDGEDLAVRRAAVEALGQFNGSVVVVDPKSGRILTMVNQKLALSGGFQPCSTIKVSVALAALQEKLVERNTKIRIYGRTKVALTDALARSNNYYFANLGIQLGYDR